jgi:hypothetical protein
LIDFVLIESKIYLKFKNQMFGIVFVETAKQINIKYSQKVSFIESKFKFKLYLNGYLYIRDRISDTIYWKCKHNAKKCKGRVIDTGNEVKEKSEHNHPGEPQKLEVRNVLSKIKSEAQQSKKEPQAVISAAIGSISEMGSSLLPSVRVVV